MKYTIFLLALFSSCSFLRGYHTKEFLYTENNVEKRLVLHIPKGYADEKLVLDTGGGKEQYFYYPNGALLYFSRNVVWATENAPFLQTERKKDSSLQTFNYTGVDKEGLHWKEIQVEDFRFGYSYVPGSSMDQFEHAMNSIRIKRKQH